MATTDFDLGLRPCLRDPIPEIFESAVLLAAALRADLDGERHRAAGLIREADMPAVRTWVAPLLGSIRDYPDRSRHVRYRCVPDTPPILPKSERMPVRMPNVDERRALIADQGRNCRFCGIPLISSAVRKRVVLDFGDVARWGQSFEDCHAAFLCMWLQFDHVLPHSRGGTNETFNILLACAGCNFGRMSHTLAEVGLLDPRQLPAVKTEWDGLEEWVRA